MQMPFVMMLALTGVGCHNKTAVVVDASPLICYQVESPPSASDQGAPIRPGPTPACSPRRLIRKSPRASTTAIHNRNRPTGTPEYVRPSTALCSVETPT